MYKKYSKDDRYMGTTYSDNHENYSGTAAAGSSSSRTDQAIEDTELYRSIMADESLAPEEGGPSFVGCDQNGDGVWQWPNGEQFIMPIGNMQ